GGWRAACRARRRGLPRQFQGAPEPAQGAVGGCTGRDRRRPAPDRGRRGAVRRAQAPGLQDRDPLRRLQLLRQAAAGEAGHRLRVRQRTEIVDGKLTGVAIEPIVDAQRKADLLRQLAEKEGLSLEQTIAVGDGANDLPMLGLAGLGVAFRAKPLVKQSAKQAISTLGLDGILYLLGFRDREGTE